MPVEGQKVELGRLIEPDRGISYGIVQPGAAVSTGVPIIRVSDIRNQQIDTTSPLHVSPEVEAAYSRTRLRGGELLMTIVGTVGETAIVPSSLVGWNVARAIAVIPVQPSVGARWVSYALRSREAAALIGSRLNTTVQATLNLGDLSRLPIPLPDRRDREAILSVLGALDDKIDLNRRMNETLEAIARALFRDWFVDFGPTRAKMEGRAPYLTPDLWALFPDALGEDGLPVGWNTSTLNDLALLHRESIEPSRLGDEAVTHFSLPAFDAGKRAVVERASSILSNKTKVPDGAILLSKLNPETPRVWLTRPVTASQHALASTEFLTLTPRGAIPRTFLYATISDRSFALRMEAMVSGTSKSHQRVSPSSVLAMEVLSPPQEVLRAFEIAIDPCLQRAAANVDESETLASVRDLLLPRLMSGELRIRDVEAMVETAL